MQYSKVSEERQALKFEDTNMANFGTEIEYKLKKDASEKEEAWVGTRETPGIRIWRIEQFEVKDWPKSDYGKFYDGDSYIVLFAKKTKEGILIFKAFMWIGEFSTQDEYGTAAYKIVELNDYLDRKATLFREVQGHECKEFLELFSGRIEILIGGVSTGFSKCEKVTEFPGRLFHIRRNDNNYRITQVPMKIGSLNNGDCFVLDKVTTIWRFEGEFCSHYEKFKAEAFIKEIKDERVTIKAEVINISGLQDATNPKIKEFWDLLGGVPDHLSEKEKEIKEDKAYVKKLLNVSDETGQMKTTLVSEGKLDKSKIDSNDVFLVDTEETLYVWIGNKTSKNEIRHAFSMATGYLITAQRPAYITVSVVNEGQEDEKFFKHFG